MTLPRGAPDYKEFVTRDEIVEQNVEARHIDSGEAGEGQVLTADGSGGATWGLGGKALTLMARFFNQSFSNMVRYITPYGDSGLHSSLTENASFRMPADGTILRVRLGKININSVGGVTTLTVAVNGVGGDPVVVSESLGDQEIPVNLPCAAGDQISYLVERSGAGGSGAFQLTMAMLIEVSA